MNSDRRNPWLPLVILIGALVVWAGWLALGTYLEWGADQPRHDPRKAWIVLGSMAGFLALWGVALVLRGRRRP
jgi:hypothetical protein